MKLNPMHTTITYGCDHTIYLTNIEGEQIIDLISFPCPVWEDKKILAEQIRKLGIEKGWI